MIDESRNSGAYQCAPRELALAVAHVEFGRNELEEGDAFRALHHIDEAELYATAAANQSDSPACDRTAFEDGLGDESKRGELAIDSDQRRTDRCRGRDGRRAWGKRQDACSNLQDTAGTDTAESTGGCNSEVSDSKGFHDRKRCVGRDTKSEEQLRQDNQCPSEIGQQTNAICLKKYSNIVITRNAIRLNKPILFEEKQVKIAPESHSTLEEVIHFLISNPQITVEIQGHTDSAGDDSYNLDFSQKRADSVRRFLIINGIAPSRLVARGYGETSPIESNHTSRGRAANRRIEIIRTD